MVKGSCAAKVMRLETRDSGGRSHLKEKEEGGVYASLQSIGTSGAISKLAVLVELTPGHLTWFW